jgi:hypothetical protein
MYYEKQGSPPNRNHCLRSYDAHELRGLFATSTNPASAARRRKRRAEKGRVRTRVEISGSPRHGTTSTEQWSFQSRPFPSEQSKTGERSCVAAISYEASGNKRERTA